jgi:hypothetical protein
MLLSGRMTASARYRTSASMKSVGAVAQPDAYLSVQPGVRERLVAANCLHNRTSPDTSPRLTRS